MIKAEKDYLKKVAELGCIICENPYVEIHHITTKRGFGKKASHYDTLPLCFLHHRGGEKGVAIHQGVKTWESIHGTQIELLEKVKSRLPIN